MGHTPEELHTFIERLPRTSRLHTAMSKDVELYREQLRRTGGKAAARKPDPPELFEYSQETEALGAIFFQLQQIAHILANQNAKKGRRRKFKGVHWPSPRTAAEMARTEDRRAAFRHLEEIVRYEDAETWQRQIEDHYRKQGGGE